MDFKRRNPLLFFFSRGAWRIKRLEGDDRIERGYRDTVSTTIPVEYESTCFSQESCTGPSLIVNFFLVLMDGLTVSLLVS